MYYMADDNKQQTQKAPDYQALYKQGGRFKEQLESISTEFRGAEAQGFREQPVEEVVEIPTEPEVEPQLEKDGYIERVEKGTELKSPTADDYVQGVLLGPTNPQNPQVKLPLTEEEIQQGLHHKVWEGIRWMAEWCVRQVKKLHGAVAYKE